MPALYAVPKQQQVFLVAQFAEAKQVVGGGRPDAALTLHTFDLTATVAGVIAARTASRSLKGTCVKPGSRGAKPSFTFAWPVAEIPAIVRP